ncbi:MAG: hypothetical protein IPF92_04920 [Myxococcales bacterium]|nr:hypothetical protein [Myxococcales bacterium]MBL0197910.1 hypothetical protein [Myxococcales bacterium]
MKNLVRSVSIFGVLALLGAAACSSTPDAADGGTDAAVTDSATPPVDATTPDSATSDSATPDSATPDAAKPDSAVPPDSSTPTTCSGADAGAQCNTVVNGATDVSVTVGTGALPIGTGGTVVDGRYFLTNLTTYPGTGVPSTLVMRQTLELCGGGSVGQLVNDQAGATKRKSFTFTRAGNVPTTTQTCESVAGDTNIPYATYTATATTMTFYAAAPYVFSATYTKQ